MTKNRPSLAGSQTLLESENEFNSTGNLNSIETVGDACKLIFLALKIFIKIFFFRSSLRELTCICSEVSSISTQEKLLLLILLSQICLHNSTMINE